MTAEDAFRGSRKAYVDSAPVIYALATAHAFGPAAQGTLAHCLSEGVALTTSPMALAECLAGESDPRRQALFLKYFTGSSGIVMVDVDSPIAIQAAALRRTTRLKLPDCVHVATALVTECDTLFTNDVQLAKTPVALRFVLVSDLDP